VVVHALPGAVVGIAVPFAVIVCRYAMLWLWVFGDDTWSATATLALLIVGYGAGLAVFIGAIWIGIQSRSRLAIRLRRLR
jgi:hypothetical protein